MCKNGEKRAHIMENVGFFFFDIMACLNIWSSFISGPVEKCGITEFIAGSITISSIVPETVEHPQTTFPPLCFTAGMKRLLSAFAWDKNICCYCSQKPLSLIHLSRVHFSKQPDLWLYVHCQTLVSLSCALRFSGMPPMPVKCVTFRHMIFDTNRCGFTCMMMKLYFFLHCKRPAFMFWGACQSWTNWQSFEISTTFR